MYHLWNANACYICGRTLHRLLRPHGPRPLQPLPLPLLLALPLQVRGGHGGDVAQQLVVGRGAAAGAQEQQLRKRIRAYLLRQLNHVWQGCSIKARGRKYNIKHRERCDRGAPSTMKHVTSYVTPFVPSSLPPYTSVTRPPAVAAAAPCAGSS